MFGLTLLPDDLEAPRPPVGFLVARVHLGAFSERVFCDGSIWSPDDYKSHWRASAQRCVEGSEGELFCSSLGRKHVDLHVGVRAGANLTFYEMHVPANDLSISGVFIRPVALFSRFIGVPSHEWSRWDVPLNDVAAFVRGANA